MFSNEKSANATHHHEADSDRCSMHRSRTTAALLLTPHFCQRRFPGSSQQRSVRAFPL